MKPTKWFGLSPALVLSIAALIIVLSRVCSIPWRQHVPAMAFPEDDAYYYWKIGYNWTHGLGCTFDGTHLTNGFHPLWFVIVAGFTLVSSHLESFVVAIAVSAAISVGFTFALTRKVLLNLGLNEWLSCGISLVCCARCVRSFLGGMEMTLDVPLIMYLLLGIQTVRLPLSFRSGIGLGIAVAAMILARIDTALLGMLLGFGVLSQREFRKDLPWQGLRGIAVGLIPLACYVAINRVYFGDWLPISGAAKQLKLGHGVSIIPLASIWEVPDFKVSLIASWIAIGVVGFRWSSENRFTRGVLTPILAFPTIYYLLLALRSDWILWRWYSYALVPALCVSLAVLALRFCSQLTESALRRWTPLALAGGVAYFFLASTWKFNLDPLKLSDRILAFSRTHRGLYAMGDRAGLVAARLDMPVLQLEGIVGDRKMLEAIKGETNLKTVLHRYGVNYYIAQIPFRYHGKFDAVEPRQAGPKSPHMRATFLEKPEAIFESDTDSVLIYRVN